MGYDDASCEYCLGVFPGAFAFRCVADFVAAVCESAGQWNLGDDEFSWHSGPGDSAAACDMNYLGASGTDFRGN